MGYLIEVKKSGGMKRGVSRAEALCAAAVCDREGDRVGRVGLIDGRCVSNQKPRVESSRGSDAVPRGSSVATDRPVDV